MESNLLKVVVPGIEIVSDYEICLELQRGQEIQMKK